MKISIIKFSMIALILTNVLNCSHTYKDGKWQYINNYKSYIMQKEFLYNLIPDPNYVIPKEAYEIFNNEKELKEFYDYYNISMSSIIKLAKFYYNKFRKGNKDNQDPLIILETIKADFIKNYDLCMITETGFDSTISAVAINKKGKDIHIFGVLGNLYRNDIVKDINLNDLSYFNKMIKREKLRVENPCIALNMCLLFLKLSSYIRDDILMEEEIYNEILKHKYGKEFLRYLKTIGIKIHNPMYIEEKEYYEIKFFTKPFTDLNHFRVYKNGKIKLIKRLNLKSMYFKSKRENEAK